MTTQKQRKKLLLQFIPQAFPITFQHRRSGARNHSFSYIRLPSTAPRVRGAKQNSWKFCMRAGTLFARVRLRRNNVSVLSSSKRDGRRVYQRCFHTSESHLVKWLRQGDSGDCWGGKWCASSSWRSCRALEITRISARVRINIEIFLWATNRGTGEGSVARFQGAEKGEACQVLLFNFLRISRYFLTFEHQRCGCYKNSCLNKRLICRF